MRKLIVAEFIILLLGVLFAWVNFTIELINWLNHQPCKTGCSLVTGTVYPNPFLTPCFYGALFFTLAFILSCLILAKSRKLVIS